jgi:hypothetical protein
MGFVWNVFERISDVVGPDGALAVFAFVLGLAGYLVLGSSSPSRR